MALDEMINLTDEEVREHFVSGITQINRVKSSQEVLFQWQIPKKNPSGEIVFELWRKVLVSWQIMQKDWVDHAFRISYETGTQVNKHINEFVAKNNFIVTQLYDELFHVCITSEQCLDIKRELEEFMWPRELPDARTQELFPGGEWEGKSFRNADKLRQFCEDLVEKNKPTIERKHEEARDHFTKLENAFNTRKDKKDKKDQKDILAFDIEVYEHDNAKVLEIGYVIVCFSPQKNHTEDNRPYLEVTKTKHLIIKENLRYSNGETCPDNRDGFVFGESKIVSLADAIERFCKDIRKCDYMLGHTTKNDDAFLRKTCIDLSDFDKEMFDTQVLETYLKERLPESEKYMRCLPYLLREYNLNYEESHLHNAGCDAFYNMMVFLRQMRYSAKEVNDVIEYYY